MQRVRIGFVGAGQMGQAAHLRNFASLDDCEVVALAELRPQTAQSVARKYGVPKVYPSHREMLAAEELDAIVASQPFLIHGQIVPELLEAGRPVFIEKPLAGSLEAGQRIADAARRHQTFVMVGYNKRCDPATIWAKSKIEELKQSGAIGALRYLRITMPPGEWIRNGFFDLVRTGEPLPRLEPDPPPPGMDAADSKLFEAFVNYYIHQLNLARHLLGEPFEPVFADRAGILLVGRSRSGATCAIEMAPYSTGRAWEESALAAFEHGYVKLDLPPPLVLNQPGRVEFYSDKPVSGPGDPEPRREIPTLPWDHSMRVQARRFLRAVRGGEPPPCGCDEALDDLRVALACHQLLSKGRGPGAG